MSFPLELSPSAFNAHIAHLGQTVLWRKGHMCPCRADNSNAALQGCPICHGKGRFWEIPQSGVLGLTEMLPTSRWREFGSYEEGDVITTLPENSTVYDLSDHDRVLFTNSSIGFTQIFRRGVDDQPLPFIPIEIEELFWIDGTEIVNCDPLPDVDIDGSLLWAEGGTTPEPGQQYSLIGRKNPQYFVTFSHLVQDRAHHHGARLPRKCVLRRWDLYGR